MMNFHVSSFTATGAMHLQCPLGAGHLPYSCGVQRLEMHSNEGPWPLGGKAIWGALTAPSMCLCDPHCGGSWLRMLLGDQAEVVSWSCVRGWQGGGAFLLAKLA